MKQKKLIIFIPTIEGGGVEKNLYIIANFISNKVKKTKLITCSKNKKNKFNNISIISPNSNIWMKMPRRFKYLISIILLIKELVKSRNQLVFAFQANFYAAIICRIFNVKIITRSNTSPDGWSKNYFKKKLYKILIKLPDIIIVNSKSFQKQFLNYFNRKTVCIYNPLNYDEIIKKSKIKINNNFFKKASILKIISVGRLVDQKDFFTLLKASNYLKGKINFRVLIIGKGKCKNKLKQYIQNNNLNKHVKILQFQFNPYKFISKADIYVLTSKYEGLPNVLLEAQSLKKYIISTDCPTGPKEILLNGKAGDLIKIGDYKKLSERILNYYNSKKLINKKINKGYKFLFRFDKKKNLSAYYSEIKKLIYK